MVALLAIYLVVAVFMALRTFIGYHAFEEERLGWKWDLFGILGWPIVLVMAAWFVVYTGYEKAKEASGR